MYIAHDLAVVEHISDRSAAMYADPLVEVARTEGLFAAPHHPYTEALIGTIPLPNLRLRKAARTRLGGEIASLTNPPSGGNIHPRCGYAAVACRGNARRCGRSATGRSPATTPKPLR